jgi:hypothetical protein
MSNYSVPISSFVVEEEQPPQFLIYLVTNSSQSKEGVRENLVAKIIQFQFIRAIAIA